MNESTARAERYEVQNEPSPVFVWEVAQKPVSVRIPFSLIDRLEHEAVESFRSLTSKGSEIGGILIGDTTPGSPLVVSIADYDLIACDYSRGPLYRLSDADMGRLEQAIQQRAGNGRSVAGFFRSHTRKGISLDVDDIAVMQARFRDPHHVGCSVLFIDACLHGSSFPFSLQQPSRWRISRDTPCRSVLELTPGADHLCMNAWIGRRSISTGTARGRSSSPPRKVRFRPPRARSE